MKTQTYVHLLESALLWMADIPGAGIEYTSLPCRNHILIGEALVRQGGFTDYGKKAGLQSSVFVGSEPTRRFRLMPETSPLYDSLIFPNHDIFNEAYDRLIKEGFKEMNGFRERSHEVWTSMFTYDGTNIMITWRKNPIFVD